MNSRASYVSSGFLLIVLLFSLVGCQSQPTLTQIDAFGVSASSLADGSKEGFQLVDDVTVMRNVYDIASDSSKFPKEDTFRGLFSVPLAATPTDIPPVTSMPALPPKPTTAEGIKVRLAVLSSLGKYSNALHELATADFRKDIDSAATDLDGALKGLRDDYGKATGKTSSISDQSIASIATAVDAIGAVIVEEKRRAAIAKIINEADKGVQEAAKLLADDFDAGAGKIPDYVTQSLRNAAGSLQQAYSTERTKPTSDFATRYRMLIDIQNAYQLADAAPSFFASIVGGAKSMATAHTALVAAVKDNKFTSSEIVDDIGGLVRYAQSVQQFYKTLQAAKTK